MYYLNIMIKESWYRKGEIERFHNKDIDCNSTLLIQMIEINEKYPKISKISQNARVKNSNWKPNSGMLVLKQANSSNLLRNDVSSKMSTSWMLCVTCHQNLINISTFTAVANKLNSDNNDFLIIVSSWKTNNIPQSYPCGTKIQSSTSTT